MSDGGSELSDDTEATELIEIRTPGLSRTQSIHLHKQFGWINKFVLYFPLWCTQTQSQEPRKCNKIWFVVITTAVIYHLIVDSIYLFSIYDKNILCKAMYFIYELVFITPCRFVSLYYFYYKCTFSWMYEIELAPIKSYMPKYTKFIQIMMIIIFAIDICQTLVFSHILISKMGSNSDLIVWEVCYFIMLWGGRIFIYWPNIIAFIVSVIIIKKYHFYLIQLNRHSFETLAFDQLLQKYKAIQESFERDYNAELLWFVQLLLAAYVLRLWSVLYEIFHYQE